MKVDGLKSNSKTTGNGCIGFIQSKLWFDINDLLIVEGDLDRMYSLLEIDSNYMLIGDRDFDIAINHTARGKTDIVLLSTLMAAVDIFLYQPSYRDFDVRNKEYQQRNVMIYLMYECSYNLTSPSMLLQYQGGLRLNSIYHNYLLLNTRKGIELNMGLYLLFACLP